MATLYITEFSSGGPDSRGVQLQVGKLPAITSQAVTISGTSAQSAALNANTRFVRVLSDTACYLVAGDNPTATSSNMRILADTPEYFAVTGGQKLAAIT